MWRVSILSRPEGREPLDEFAVPGVLSPVVSILSRPEGREPPATDRAMQRLTAVSILSRPEGREPRLLKKPCAVSCVGLQSSTAPKGGSHPAHRLRQAMLRVSTLARPEGREPR